MERTSVERGLQGGHLIEKNTERPDIRLKAIAFALDDLRG
jgi:hypothetical protein